jgi:hypothetical protein
VIRPVAAAVLFAAGTFALLAGGVTGQQPADKKQPANKFAPPKVAKPDDATLKQIKDKTEQLRTAVAGLKAKAVPDDVLIEVAVYLKAAENIVRFEEWFNASSGKWALTTLDQGLDRAKQAAGGKTPWRDAAGKWVVRAYRSRIDDSIQPYAVLLPPDYGKDPKKKWRLDIVLHGRDSSITEAKFIATHDGSKPAPKELGFVQLEVYGRGNNAYRWAGEADVSEAMWSFLGLKWRSSLELTIDLNRVVLRGFSMGGAGTWHLGLHHPDRFCVIGPGAGFTTTHGYIANLPKELPDYQEKCLRIYDAQDYAENAFNVPVVAYSGEKDAQKKAADNIENALKGFKEPLRFKHLIAPGLEHQMPAEWQAKAETEYRKYADGGRQSPDRVRFVTYTPRYGECDWVMVKALEKTYEKATVDATRKGSGATVTTTNVRRLALFGKGKEGDKATFVIDGQSIDIGGIASAHVTFEKSSGKWTYLNQLEEIATGPFPGMKVAGRQGPIDDAFMGSFTVVAPSGKGWHAAADGYAPAAVARFAAVWDKYFRGVLPQATADAALRNGLTVENLVLFGDPASNPLIAKMLPKLPITWTKDELVVNGVTYDAKTHLPVLIYPMTIDPGLFTERLGYVVLNSGHTFKEADLKGTNALLYPRLGDWAVIKPTPTEKDPAAYEVVAAGLFDENWQFPKK